MNANDMLDIIGEIKGSYVLEAQRHREEQGRKRSKLTLLLVAAMISVLLTGCAVAYVLHLEDMQLGMKDYATPNDTQPDMRTVLSLQGVIGSHSYNASREWFEFQQSYRPTPETDPELTDEEKLPYTAYPCYTRKAADKIDEICKKYGLRLHGEEFYGIGLEKMCDLLGIRGIFRESAVMEEATLGGSFYQDGGFCLYGNFTAEGPGAWPYPVLMEYRYNLKNVFDTAYLALEDLENCRQWNYTTEDGAELLLVLTPTRAMIFADKQAGFLSITIQNFNHWDVKIPAEKDQLESIAEFFDFQIQPNPMAQGEVNAARDLSLAAAETCEVHDYWKQADYAGYADTYLRGIIFTKPVSDPYYILRDMNGDGEEELVIFRDGKVETIATMEDGVTIEFIYAFQAKLELCEGNYLMEHNENGENGWRYLAIYRYDHDIRPENVKVMAKKDDGIWYDCPSMNPISEEAYDTPLTEEQVQSILDDYPVIDPADLDLKPLKDLAAEAE